MTEEELIALCEKKNLDVGKSIWLYWPAELYSFGKYIREYGYFPKILPLAIYCEHSGPSYSDTPYKHEVETEAPIFLSHSLVKAIKYSNITGKKAYPMMSPSVFYRRKNNIIREKNAIGTIAFPSHSLPTWELKFDVKKYCADLKRLPIEFQPLSVCLHMHDINSQVYKDYQREGLNVVTAGNTSDYRFIERLYSLMKNSKYATSNIPGTIGPLCIEMGMPFFIYGDYPQNTNISDINYEIGETIVASDRQAYYHNKTKLTEDFNLQVVDKELFTSVEGFLGLENGISRLKMAFVLWYALFLWICKFGWYKWLKNNRYFITGKLSRLFQRNL